jgi:hypothetical protein
LIFLTPQDKAGKKPSTRFIPAVYRRPLRSKALEKFYERAKPGLNLAGIIGGQGRAAEGERPLF